MRLITFQFSHIYRSHVVIHKNVYYHMALIEFPAKLTILWYVGICTITHTVIQYFGTVQHNHLLCFMKILIPPEQLWFGLK